MDQNFSLMAQSRANYYTAGSPVQFVRVELLKGDVTGEVAVCLTFKNVGTEPLTGFIIHFKCKDASGQILCEDDFYYEQLNVQPGELFGADDAVFVSDTPVSSVEIEQDRAFLNGRGVDLRNYKRVRLQAPRVLPGSIARTLQTRTNNKMLTCVPQDTENGWFCACGAFHPNEEAVSVCSECGGDRAYIKATLTRILEEARQTAEQQQREINAVANGVDPAAAQAAQAAATAAAAQAAMSPPHSSPRPPRPRNRKMRTRTTKQPTPKWTACAAMSPKAICLPMKRMKRTSIPACSMMRKRKATMTKNPAVAVMRTMTRRARTM